MKVLSAVLLIVPLAAVCVAAPSRQEGDPVLFKKFDDVKAALLAGQELGAWVEFKGCKVISAGPLDDGSSAAPEGIFRMGDDAGPTIETWTQKFSLWQWTKYEGQEVFWFPSNQALGGGNFASERVLLWQNGTVLLDVVMEEKDKNATMVLLNCTLGTSALFRGWSDLKKPVDTPANAIKAANEQGAELAIVTVYGSCTKSSDGDEDLEAMEFISGQCLTDAVVGTDENGDPMYMGASSYLERSPDGVVKALGDEIMIMNNGTVLVDTFVEALIGTHVISREYRASCDFGKSILVFV